MSVPLPAASAPTRPPIERLSAPVLLTLLAVWLLATLGWRPLLLPDEGRYAEVARAMTLAPDGWLVPRLDGLPFFHKPPLFYWLDLLAMRLVGVNEWSARFGSAVGAWLMGAALLLWMRRRHGARTAAIGLLVLATTPLFFVAGQYANHDMLVGGLITVAVLAIARAVEAPPRVDLRWLVTGWIACALAVLAKGLIGLVLPALVIVPWLVAQRRWSQVLGLLHPGGIAAFVLVGLPWFVAMQRRYPGFYDYFVLEQHFRRFAGAEFNNAHGAWFFFVLLPLATLPWSGFAIAGVRRRRRLRPLDATTGLYVWWTLAVVGFFSLPSSKLIGYVLPALAPWCALLVLWIARRPARGVAVTAGLSATVLVALVVGVAWKAPGSNRALAQALAREKAPADRIVAVGDYLYDLPFYARLAEPVRIADDWADPELARHDNWKKEIADAARFDPPLGRELLVRGDHLEAGCTVTWFVLPPDRAGSVAALPGAARRFADRRRELWRVDARADCHQ